MPPPSTIPSTRKRKLLPVPSASPLAGENPPSSPSSTVSGSTPGAEEDDEYAPGPSKQPARKAKRLSAAGGPATLNSAASSAAGGKAKAGADGKATKTKGMSREQLRKANHSLIERRRREKINAALGELRDMVPGLGDDGGKGGEFKLEVLERTVAHMKELKQRIAELELGGDGSVAASMSREGSAMSGPDRQDREQRRDTTTDMIIDPQLSHPSAQATQPDGGWGKTSPYPSPSPDQRHLNHHLAQTHTHPPPHPHSHHLNLRSNSHTHSPDPNETEVESNLPPPLARAGSRFSLSSASASTRSKPSTPQENVPSPLLGASHSGHPARTQALPPPTRPPPPAHNANPIFLPFPAPSPTSPFMNATISGTPSASTSTTAPSEPSPFLPPIPNLGLFGGMLNLDASPQDTFRAGYASKQGSPPSLSLPESKKVAQPHGFGAAHAGAASGMGVGNGKHAPNSKANADMAPEEAANLLLAFSSPDTLRPQSESMMAAMQAQQTAGRGRRMTLETEEFSLDGGGAAREGEGNGAAWSAGEREGGRATEQRPIVGKSVKDILRLS
ncbi:hypothetical protein IAT38_001571 [Cryptococcus sp. DSM 104549]